MDMGKGLDGFSCLVRNMARVEGFWFEASYEVDSVDDYSVINLYQRRWTKRKDKE